jgi:hypothetical protein
MATLRDRDLHAPCFNLMATQFYARAHEIMIRLDVCYPLASLMPSETMTKVNVKTHPHISRETTPKTCGISPRCILARSNQLGHDCREQEMVER